MPYTSITTAVHKRVYSAFTEGAINKSAFSESVAMNATASAGLHPLSNNLPCDEYFANAEANHQKLWRKIDRKTQEFHIDLFIPIVRALPEPYKSFLINDFIVSCKEQTTAQPQKVKTSAVIKEVAEAIIALSDGSLDEQLKEITEAITHLRIMKDEVETKIIKGEANA